MRREWLRQTLSLFFLVGFSIGIKAAWAQDKGITIVTGDDYPPITSQKLKHGGLGLRIVMRAFELAQFPVEEVKWQPWARGYSLTQSGVLDAAFPWGPTPERYKIFYFSDPILHMTNYAYVLKKSDVSILQRKDLKGKVYCNPNGYGDFGVIKELKEKNLMTREAPLNMVSCFKMLKEGRVDLVVSPQWDADYGISGAKLDMDTVRREPMKVAQTPLSLIVSLKNKRGPEIISAFNKGLKKLKETGEFIRIYHEFGFDEFLEPNS